MKELLKWAPSCEQEVVILFGMVLPHLDEKYVIDECRTAFPDCLLLNEDGDIVRAEFELHSSNFKQHGHDPDGCDMLICWRHDWRGCPIPEILELSSFIKEKEISIIQNQEEQKYKKTIWDQESFFKKAGPTPKGFVDNLYYFCLEKSDIDFIEGGGKKVPSFNIKLTAPGAPSRSFLGVYADGRIWPDFKQDWPKEIIDEYRERWQAIERVKEKAAEKDWFYVTLENEDELELVKGMVGWLAGFSWKD